MITQRSVSSTCQVMSRISVDPSRMIVTPARSTTATMGSTYRCWIARQRSPGGSRPPNPTPYRCPMQSLPSVRMTANLNSLLRGQQSLEQAERAIRHPDTAHHLVDPDEVLGVDPLAATPL